MRFADDVYIVNYLKIIPPPPPKKIHSNCTLLLSNMAHISLVRLYFYEINFYANVTNFISKIYPAGTT